MSLPCFTVDHMALKTICYSNHYIPSLSYSSTVLAKFLLSYQLKQCYSQLAIGFLTVTLAIQVNYLTAALASCITSVYSTVHTQAQLQAWPQHSASPHTCHTVLASLPHNPYAMFSA